MGRRTKSAIVLMLLAALVGGTVASPVSADRLRPPGKKASRIKTQLQKRLEGRGLENVDIRRCLIAKKKVRGKKAIECTWYAEGILPGPQPYRCHGDALHGKLSEGGVGFIRISACVNKARVQIPIEPAPVHEPLFGYNDEWTTAPPTMFELVDRLEPTYVRWGIDWNNVVRPDGSRNWNDYDALYRQLQARGIRLIAPIGGAPCFAQTTGGRCDPEGHPGKEYFDDMADFAAEAVRRYPNLGAIEVWNEPNTAKYWGDIPEPDLYAEMFKVVEERLDDVAPDMPVLFGALSPHAEADENTVPAAEFLAQGYDLGAVQQSDAISTHPYPGTAPGESVTDGVAKRLGDLWEVMLLERDTDRPLWITETGVSTFGDRAYTPEDQAAALVEIYDAIRRIPQVRVLILHRFRDAQGDNPFEPGYGSVTDTLSPKPAYCAIGATRGLTVC